MAWVWLSLGTRDFRKKKSDPLYPKSGRSIKRHPNQVSARFKKVYANCGHTPRPLFRSLGKRWCAINSVRLIAQCDTTVMTPAYAGVGTPDASERLRAQICRLPLISSHSAVLCAHRHIRQVPHQWNKSRDTSSPGNKISVSRQHYRVKSGPHRLEFGRCPAHLGLPHLFSRPTLRRKNCRHSENR